MNKEINSIANSIKESGILIGNSLKKVDDYLIRNLKERIAFLEEVLKYTKKHHLKRKHEKSLTISKTSLNSLTLGNKVSEYLNLASDFAKGIK